MLLVQFCSFFPKISCMRTLGPINQKSTKKAEIAVLSLYTTNLTIFLYTGLFLDDTAEVDLIQGYIFIEKVFKKLIFRGKRKYFSFKI